MRLGLQGSARRLRRRGTAAAAALLGLLALLVVPRLAELALGAYALPARASAPTSAEPPGRRAALAAAGLAGLGGTWSPAPARAEIAWQLKLPRSWQVFSTSDQPPPGERKPVALVVAGNAEQGGELTVLRVPIDTSDASPDKPGSTALVKYFSGQKPGASKNDVVEALARSQKTVQGQTKFALVGGPVETVRNGRRYIRYDYESAICQGSLEKGVKVDRCVVPETGEELPQLERTHSVTLTVDQEEGDTLWFVDISAPTVNWPNAKAAIDDLAMSFEVGDPERLEKERTAAIEAQAKLLNAAKEQAEKPQASK